MSSKDSLHSDSFIVYAAKNYTNPDSISDEEFFDDLKRIKYIKRLFRLYEETGELKERLILNHLLVFYNVFGLVPANRMLFFRLDSKYYPYLKTFLDFLGYLPNRIENIGLPPKSLNMCEIEPDITIMQRLKSI
jgi:hypothetical protein